MGVMRERIRHFMQGRYGMDDLSRVLLGAAFICGVLSLFFGRFFYLICICAVAYAYFRVLSTNYEKRFRENRAFTNWKYKAMALYRREKSMMEQRKTHRIYTCPGCRQKIRIPKGHGRIIVTCPKCRFEFQKRS